MHRKFINSILFFSICLYINSQKALLSETKNNIEKVLKEKATQIYVDYSDIVDTLKIIKNLNH